MVCCVGSKPARRADVHDPAPAELLSSDGKAASDEREESNTGAALAETQTGEAGVAAADTGAALAETQAGEAGVVVADAALEAGAGEPPVGRNHERAVDDEAAAAEAAVGAGVDEAPIAAGEVVESSDIALISARISSGSHLSSGSRISSGSPARRPTEETLLPEPKDKRSGATLAEEWDDLDADELEVLRKVRGWLGAEAFERVPLDLLVTFTRGYAYRADRADASFVFLERALKWRAETAADRIVLQQLPNRELFEELCPSAPMGHDKHGHTVIIERLGRVQVKELFRHFDEETYIRHQAFSREAVRLISTANSLRLGRRIYKVVVVLDLEGLSVAHVGQKFINLCKKVNGLFGWHYPETAYNFYVINAPLAFRAAWAIAKQFIHPITVSKFSILGTEWRKTFDEAGIVLTQASPTKLGGWAAAVRKVLDEHPADRLCRGFMPETDLARLRALP